MGFLGFFKSKEEKFRSLVRDTFDESVKSAIRKNGRMILDPFCGGMIVQAAIGSVYQTLKNDPKLALFAISSSFDPYNIIEEECRRALNNYLE